MVVHLHYDTRYADNTIYEWYIAGYRYYDTQ